MINKRIYARVKNNKKEAHLFEFPLLHILNGDCIRLEIDKCKVTLFIADKGLSHEEIDGYGSQGTIYDPKEWLRELCERQKQAE